MTKMIFRFVSSFLAFLSLAHADLWVSSFGNSEVIEYNGQTGAYIRTFVTSGSGGLNGPLGIAFGPNGNLYVVSGNTNEVIEYNGQTGAYITTFVTFGSGGLSGAFGITFGPDGNLYVVSLVSSDVLEYNGQTGAYITTFVPSGSGGLSLPEGITFGPDGNLYVTSTGGDDVLEYNGQTGAYITTFVASASGGLAGPVGITFGQDGNLYLTSAGNSEVIEYNGQTGAPITTFVTSGSGGLFAPTFLVFSPPTGRAFQTRYAANLTAGDSYIDLTNDGSTGGNICVNVYAFDPAEELVACCACNLTPNALQSLSVKTDLLSNTLTPATPTSITVKLMATSNTGGSVTNCNAANPDGLAPALEAWGTTIHATPQGTYRTTETQFSIAGLSSAEFQQITGTCGFIQSNASGYGICKSCQPGGLGAVKQ